MADKEWSGLQELAEEWSVPIARIRTVVSVLEGTDSTFQVRDRPGDKRYKQVHRDSIEKIHRAIFGK